MFEIVVLHGLWTHDETIDIANTNSTFQPQNLYIMKHENIIYNFWLIYQLSKLPPFHILLFHAIYTPHTDPTSHHKGGQNNFDHSAATLLHYSALHRRVPFHPTLLPLSKVHWVFLTKILSSGRYQKFNWTVLDWLGTQSSAFLGFEFKQWKNFFNSIEEWMGNLWRVQTI